MEYQLKIRRLKNDDTGFKGDRNWQTAPYPEKTRAALQVRLKWLERTVLSNIPFESKIVAHQGR